MLEGPMAMLHTFHTHPNSSADTNSRSLRPTLLREEHKELLDALDVGERLQIAREIADNLYVVYGTAWVYRIDAKLAFQIIHEKAMEKMEAGHRRPDGKIAKPPGFVPPDLRPAVRPLDAWGRGGR
jgi:NTP pyrophosphatase (non-canonical NTP hydrolase)